MTAARLFLVGARGTGKSTVGREVAARLGWAFADADAELEHRLGRTIADVFTTDGEPAFRDHEADVLADLAGKADIVVATGGGAVLRAGNRDLLRTGFVVWLTATADELWRRIETDPATAGRRPNLTATGGRAEIEAVLAARGPLYQLVADVVIDTMTFPPAAAAGEIIAAFRPPHEY